MEATNTKISKDYLFITGIFLIPFSTLILEGNIGGQGNATMGIFFLNYLISMGYLIAMLTVNFGKHRWRLSKGKLRHTVLLLILLLISAFSLNREMNVFEDSVDWLCVFLVLSSVAAIAAPWIIDIKNRAIQYIISFFVGAALILFLYYSMYLLPMSIFGVVGMVALGISIHVFVPLFLVIAISTAMVRAFRFNNKLIYPLVFGALLPILFTISFLIAWNSTSRKIDSVINQNALNDTQLPSWVAVSQKISPNFLSERLLKAGLVYHEADLKSVSWMGLSNSFSEKKKHDPLVVLAGVFVPKPNLDEKTKIQILKAVFRNRHQAEERLWSGDRLITASQVSNIQLFPQYRVAYTEETFTIKNTANWNWSSQEAVYTFHLAEGSVVSSLSLWINGREEKSRLTTKAKADSAYRTIVGVESRDPSVIHWQEGNVVSLRVFPCTPRENRTFKMGVTSPLSKRGNELFYQPITFQGPISLNALRTVQVTSAGKADGLRLPQGFNQIGSGVYRSEDIQQPPTEIRCIAPPLSGRSFSFDGSTYHLTDYREKLAPFVAQQIYLDLNASWTKDSYDSVCQKFNGTPIYVYDGEMQKLNEKNKDQLFERLSANNFSLFPFYEIANPQSSLVISKGNNATPNLSDLQDTEFGDRLAAYLGSPKQINFYHFGPLTSPYLKALKELRVLNCMTGSLSALNKVVDRKQFINSQESESAVVIPNSGMMILKIAGDSPQNAPDHLLRLFAYNDIMKKVSPHYFTKNYIDTSIINKAEKAYIVSPVSSMIVLESKKDYDRFDIEANKNSLKNASMKSSGAVPEPQEWALFLLCFIVITYFLLNKGKYNRTSAC